MGDQQNWMTMKQESDLWLQTELDNMKTITEFVNHNQMKLNSWFCFSVICTRNQKTAHKNDVYCPITKAWQIHSLNDGESQKAGDQSDFRMLLKFQLSLILEVTCLAVVLRTYSSMLSMSGLIVEIIVAKPAA